MDSLRGVAALGVLLSHVAIFTGNAQRLSWGVLLANLDVGVAIFFVLSGFLLYRPFAAAEVRGEPRPRVRDYARRRVLRIVPAYWLALTVLALYPGVPGVFSGDWWRYYGFVQFYSYRTSIRGLGVAWTLCVEVAFYVVLPLYALATRALVRRLAPERRLAGHLTLLGVLGLGSVLLRVLDQGVVMQNSLLTHFYWFALGMSLAMISAVGHERRTPPGPAGVIARWPGRCWAAALLVYLVMCAALSSARGHLYYSVPQACVEYLCDGLVAVLLVAPAAFGDRGTQWPRRLLRHPLLAWLGLISYGVYLWHANVAIWFISHDIQTWPPVLAGDLAVTLAVAAASYYLVERPILRFKDRRGGRPLSPPPDDGPGSEPPGAPAPPSVRS